MRDHNGERGPVPTDYRAHDWQTCELMRSLADVFCAWFVATRKLERRGRDGVRGRFARGTFRVRL